MARTLDLLPAAVEAVRSVWRGPDAGSLSDGDLVAVHDRYCRMRRMLDADQALLAAEIARRSRPELGPDSLDKTHGYRNPTALIAATSGGSIGDAARLVKVGEATTPRQLLSGETAPARHPHVAAALSAATLTERAAAAIIALLDRVALTAGQAAIDAAEMTLVTQAPGLNMDQLNKVLIRAEATLDPDGVARREGEARADTSLSIREDRGRIIMHAELDPARGAPVKAAIEAIVADEMRTTRDAHRNGTAGPLGPGVARRSVQQMQADALVRLCEHALGCSQTDLPLAGATVVVRINHEDLVNNTGFATIDGIDAPVSVSTARRMAAGGGIISCVLGGDSQVLDWGRIKRLYTATQKLVLVERDGGCAMCGAPPGRTKVHHIKWWARDAGPTDLSNGLLLDDPCHHTIHDEGWEIYVEGVGVKAKVWFIPPPHIDPTRTPRLGGRPIRLRRLTARWPFRLASLANDRVGSAPSLPLRAAHMPRDGTVIPTARTRDDATMSAAPEGTDRTMTANIRDVAIRAGVSVGTVSNVLNHREKVSPDAERRVREAIEALGYVRNDAARQLRMGRSTTVGLVVLDVRNPFFTDLARGAESEAARHGLSVILGNSDEDIDREANYLDLFEEQRVRGILISPYREVGPRLRRLRERGTPAVLVDRRSDDEQFSSVSVDDEHGGWLAAHHLIETGRRRILFTGGPLDIRQVVDRRAGAQRAVDGAAGVTLETLPTAAASVADGRATGEAIAARPADERPDAVFAVNDLIAMGVLQGLAAHGIRVPDEIAIIGFDDIVFASAAVVPLSSVRQPSQLMGETALRILLAEIDDPGGQAQQIVFEPELVVRASTAAASR